MSRVSPMFTRLLMRAMSVRRGRMVTALLALTVAVSVATALLNLYVDLEAKLTREFRKLGANVLITAPEGTSLTSENLASIRQNLGADDITSPVAYAVAQTTSGQPVVVVGIDFAAARKMNDWWAVSVWPSSDHGALVGARAEKALSQEQDPSLLSFGNRPHKLLIAGTLKTGGPEDSRIYIPLAELSEWTGVQPSTVEVTIQGSPAQVNPAMDRLQSAVPQMAVRPIRQVTEAETRVLGKTRSILLASSIVITFMVVLCVLATLTASVLERRKDFAVMKALGSSQQMVAVIFLAEALVLALLASFLGFALGSAAAAAIGRLNFHAAVVPRWEVFPMVLIGAIVVALMSAALPLAHLQKIEPAVMLKGD